MSAGTMARPAQGRWRLHAPVVRLFKLVTPQEGWLALLLLLASLLVVVWTINAARWVEAPSLAGVVVVGALAGMLVAKLRGPSVGVAPPRAPWRRGPGLLEHRRARGQRRVAGPLPRAEHAPGALVAHGQGRGHRHRHPSLRLWPWRAGLAAGLLLGVGRLPPPQPVAQRAAGRPRPDLRHELPSRRLCSPPRPVPLRHHGLRSAHDRLAARAGVVALGAGLRARPGPGRAPGRPVAPRAPLPPRLHPPHQDHRARRGEGRLERHPRPCPRTPRAALAASSPGCPPAAPHAFRSFGAFLPFQGSISLEDEPLFQVRTDKELYWRARVYPVYTPQGWIQGDVEEAGLQDAFLLGQPRQDRRTVEVDYTVTLVYTPSALPISTLPLDGDLALEAGAPPPFRTWLYMDPAVRDDPGASPDLRNAWDPRRRAQALVRINGEYVRAGGGDLSETLLQLLPEDILVTHVLVQQPDDASQEVVEVRSASADDYPEALRLAVGQGTLVALHVARQRVSPPGHPVRAQRRRARPRRVLHHRLPGLRRHAHGAAARRIELPRLGDRPLPPAPRHPGDGPRPRPRRGPHPRPEPRPTTRPKASRPSSRPCPTRRPSPPLPSTRTAWTSSSSPSSAATATTSARPWPSCCAPSASPPRLVAGYAPGDWVQEQEVYVVREPPQPRMDRGLLPRLRLGRVRAHPRLRLRPRRRGEAPAGGGGQARHRIGPGRPGALGGCRPLWH